MPITGRMDGNLACSPQALTAALYAQAAMLESFTLETFEGRLGERFRVSFEPDQATEVELVETISLGEDAEGGRAPFSLLFRTELHEPYPQRIYPVEHEELGRFELFLVPIAPDERGSLYEAVFS
jgi:hypothetical protein